MAIDEAKRHDLYNGLEEILSPERASALMELLPPVGWADVATKHDLALQDERFNIKLDATEQRILGTMRKELLHQTRVMIVFMSSLFVAVASLAFTAARLS